MECVEKCSDDSKKDFKVVCPGIYNNFPHKILSDNKKFKDICQPQQHHARIAYNNDWDFFELFEDGSIAEYEIDINELGQTDYIVKDTEIMKHFLENYHITPTWIDCNYTWGWFDEETGNWTGAVGKVKLDKAWVSKNQENLQVYCFELQNIINPTKTLIT